jgi:hypothetical protein
MPYHLRGIGPHRKAKHPNNDHTTPNLTELEAVEVAGRRSGTFELTKGTDLSDLVQIGNDANGCWSVTFNPKSDPDPVNHPPHYTFGKYEVIDVLQDWFATNPLLWQVAKYIARADHKGNPIQDLEKAKFYLEREIQRRKAGESQ